MYFDKWKLFVADKNNLKTLLFTLVVFIAMTIIYTEFLQYNEIREGFKLSDPILNLLPAYDLTWLIFITLYSISFLFAIKTIKNPIKTICFLQVYMLVMILRMICMFLLPLNPPDNMIILADPFVELLVKGKVLQKDLFFSGHTATIFTFYLLSRNKLSKKIFLTSTIVVAISVLIQHVHYTIDVIMAIIAVSIAFKVQKTLRPKIMRV